WATSWRSRRRFWPRNRFTRLRAFLLPHGNHGPPVRTTGGLFCARPLPCHTGVRTNCYSRSAQPSRRGHAMIPVRFVAALTIAASLLGPGATRAQDYVAPFAYPQPEDIAEFHTIIEIPAGGIT